MKPKAKYCLSNEQKIDVSEWVKGWKVLDGYASNLGRCVDSKQKIFLSMKIHDCHIFIKCLLPIVFSALPEPIWKTLIELSQFFRDLCSKVLWEDHLLQMEKNIPLILCKMERIFPSTFFDSMEHLPIHLADLDIWVKSFGKKKWRVFGLGTIAKTLIPLSIQLSLLSNS